MTFYYWKHGNGNWYWHLKAANNEIIAQGEGYKNEADCLAAIELVKKSSSAPVKKA